jgi:hypothetical protein
MPRPVPYNTLTSTPEAAPQTDAEAVELAMALNALIQSTAADRPLHPNTHQSSEPISTNGWGVSARTNDNVSPVVPTNNDVSTPVSSASVPSAPPIPDGVLDEGPIHYPSIDFSPVEWSIPATEDGGPVINDVKDEDSSSLCVICWEAPIAGACIPCGHMAGCMSCLNEIKAKKSVCPVCRAKINQVLRLYDV